MYQIQDEVEGMGASAIFIRKQRERGGRRAEIPDEIAKKLKSCSVLNCEEWRDLESYTTYHCFPTGEKNQERWEIWTQLLRKAREDDSWIPFRGSLVCSHHFRPEDFVNDPFSKRRKLIKNAIPSIFPTFTVDLEDPSYQVPDEANELEMVNEPTDSGYAIDDVDPSTYLDISQDDNDSYEYQNGSTVSLDSSIQEVNDDDDVQILETTLPQQTSFCPVRVAKLISSNVPPSNPKRINRASNGIPPLAKIQVISPPQITLQKKQSQVSTSSKPQLMVISSCGGKANNATLKSRTISHTNLQRIQHKKFETKQQDVMKSIPQLPFALNPDLEIEVLDPVGAEDLSVCRQRISELEQENRSLITMYENEIETLKQSYEFEIRKLQQQVRQQKKQMEINMISLTPAKKVRLA